MVSYGANLTPPVCLNGKALPIFLSVMHILFDFALLSVPLFVLWKTQMSTSKKLKLCFLFSIGSVSCIGSVMRQVVQTNFGPDFTCKSSLETGVLQKISALLITVIDNAVTSFQWTTVDVIFAITAASLPVFNEAIPKSWQGGKSHGTHQLNYISNSSSNSDSNDLPRSESELTIYKPGQSDLFFHSEEILREDEKDRRPSVVQLPAYSQACQLPHLLPTSKPSYKIYPQVTSDAQRTGQVSHNDIV